MNKLLFFFLFTPIINIFDPRGFQGEIFLFVFGIRFLFMGFDLCFGCLFVHLSCHLLK